MNNIASRLRQVRKNLGFSQTEFSEITGKARPTISRYERGTLSPDGDFLIQLKEKLNISIDWLLTGVGDPKIGIAPYIPMLLQSCVVGVVLTFEKHDQKWTLKRLAQEIDTEYQRLLPVYADGKTPIIDLDEATIETLRARLPASKLA